MLTVGTPSLLQPAETSPDESAPASANRLGIRTEHHGRAVIVYIDGELYHRTADLLRDHVLTITGTPSRPDRVILDLDRVSFCDSSGLGALITVWKAVHARRRNLVVSRPSEVCRRLLQRTGLDQYLTISPTLRHALT
ncbi:anti-sigma factor antagonist, partial [Actinomadura sp. KC06]|uniref:STAS domain-containing protein n=1 Tax=Actinomadura sp. KC06 TaxID=2530369 RepID=UPI00104D159B